MLKTLTEDTSSDTVWASVVMLFLANILFHDYGSLGENNFGRCAGPHRQPATRDSLQKLPAELARF